VEEKVQQLETRMQTIEDDIRAKVSAEHQAAIAAERKEADRRVAVKEEEIEEHKALYAKEARARKIIHNKLLELRCDDACAG